jgi:hypothetical protein
MTAVRSGATWSARVSGSAKVTMETPPVSPDLLLEFIVRIRLPVYSKAIGVFKTMTYSLYSANGLGQHAAQADNPVRYRAA